MMRVLLFTSALALAACESSSPAPRPAPQYPPQPYYGYGQQPAPGYPGYPQQQPGYPPPQQPPPQQPPPQQPPPAARPLLPPITGAAAWQAEVRSIIAELINTLSADNQRKVRGIPIAFDPTPTEVNAFAGCDDSGSPYIAGTDGLLEATDGMAQTKATDEMFGTRTYEQYMGWVAPRLTSKTPQGAALPMGMIPAQYALDPRRLSRAREIFDEIIAFTFGHELAHHYLGHTGCANGQPMGSGPNPAILGHIATRILPGLNQPNEIACDNASAINVLYTGRARQGVAYRWTENGGLTLLDFFGRLQAAGGLSPFNPIGFLLSHPNPALRIPIVRATAQTWRAQNPG
jgi:hypothetical protein